MKHTSGNITRIILYLISKDGSFHLSLTHCSFKWSVSNSHIYCKEREREEEHENREVSDSIFTWMSRRKKSEQVSVNTTF